MHVRRQGTVLLAAALLVGLSACTSTEASDDVTEASAPATSDTTTDAASDDASASAAPTADPEEVEALELEVGDCIFQDALSGDQVSEATTVDCAAPHDAEIFAALTHADGDYPGEETIRAEAEEFCVAEFEKFIGMSFWDSALNMTSLYPTSPSWTFADDRISLCILLLDEEVTGSMAGAKI